MAKASLILGCLGLLFACSDSPNLHQKTISPQQLLVEGLKSPLNVHHTKPNLSWVSPVVAQSHYQIQVASTPDLLAKNTPDLWDSEKVATRRSINVAYSGQSLNSKQSVFWRVKIWYGAAGENRASDWSEVATWEQGLLNKSDWQANWLQASGNTKAAVFTPGIGKWVELAGTVENAEGEMVSPSIPRLTEMPPAQLFRHTFTVSKKPVKARLHSTAAGYYEVFINGKNVSDRIMDPGQTDYDKRILYNTDNVTSAIVKGNNAIAVHLGSGWYHEDIAFNKVRSLAYGLPAFIAQLELTYQDGTSEIISSNEQWKNHPSPVVKEGLFSGEVFDANLVVNNWETAAGPRNINQWAQARPMNNWPTASLEPQLLPPIRAVQEVKPIAVLQVKENVWVFDFGQNFTGIPTLNLATLNLQKGQTVYLRYAEWADKQGNISQRSGGGFATLLNQVDAYTASGADNEHWTPTFTWHGFRYIEITGIDTKPSLSSISAHLVKSDVEQAGVFASSSAHLNRVHDTALWSYRSNLISVPMDCPIRERAGWTGDAHAALVTGNYNFNMQNFWEKYLDDFKTATFIAPAIVPGKRTLGKAVDWAVAEVFIAWEHYQHYQDERLLKDQYESLLEYMNFGQSQLSEFLIAKGYGDWCDPVSKPGLDRVGGRGTPQHTKPIITSTALFARAADLMSNIAKIVERPGDAKKYATLFSNMASKFHATFYNQTSGHYGSQTADAMALRFGITPVALRQKVADALNTDVVKKWGGHSSVGALGQTWLYLALSDYGYGDTALNIFMQKGYPGFHYLFDDLNGTTLWERKGAFDPNGTEAPSRSLNHPFHGGYDGWFYQGLGGIRPLKEHPGFQEFMLMPVFPEGLNEADVSYKSGYGKIQSNWRRDKNTITWQITVPANSTAHVHLPNRAPQIFTMGSYTFTIEKNEI